MLCYSLTYGVLTPWSDTVDTQVPRLNLPASTPLRASGVQSDRMPRAYRVPTSQSTHNANAYLDTRCNTAWRAASASRCRKQAVHLLHQASQWGSVDWHSNCDPVTMPASSASSASCGCRGAIWRRLRRDHQLKIPSKYVF